ncbi:lariat debranching enzyme [Macrosteles quadrilineatus]|uniref:lariat debranching enzyme n=1 Tax=Macrosteles quadrilineatus TaxID=74068 RepID=UPI0023E2C2A5|nr:lariat debranching enzyme [Macrosteles quadrilineatus]XP_054286454.1 lariat debranching enzyme [Macrosteles quadrilineatus]
MKIAIEGCAHGELEKIYNAIQYMEKEGGFKVDLLICCGDFQSTRNSQDLSCMAVSQKYRNICSFYKYYSGGKEAPILTLFIGGNHEASNHLQELPYGGWVAPNIYYLGYAGVVNFGGVRIAGLSGIYKSRDYMKGHYEKPPYSEETKRSVYHIRNLEVFRLKQLTQPVDIMLSHDWPRGVTDYGDVDTLLQRKPFFQQDIEQNALGSKPAEELLHELKPTYWFAAHLHCKFAAIVPHGPRKGDTRFLALDKCLPKRKFLQIMELDHDDSQTLELSYDLEWLTILHLTNHLLSVKKGITYMPGPSGVERWIFTPTEEEKAHVLKRFNSELKVPRNFSKTVPAWSEEGGQQGRATQQFNPQTTTFCELLGVDDPLTLLSGGDETPGTSTPTFFTPDRSRDTSQVSFTSPSDYDETCSQSSFSNTSFTPSPIKRMSLPPPKLELPDDSSEDLLSTSQVSQDSTANLTATDSVNTTASLNESVLSQSTCETDASQEPSEDGPPIPNKKFKRRNQALYTSTEED